MRNTHVRICPEYWTDWTFFIFRTATRYILLRKGSRTPMCLIVSQVLTDQLFLPEMSAAGIFPDGSVSVRRTVAPTGGTRYSFSQGGLLPHNAWAVPQPADR